MQLEFVFIGKTIETYLADGIEIYKKKIAHYVSVKTSVVVPSNEKSTERVLKEEAEKLLKNISQKDFVIVLDERGKEFTSIQFANELQKIMNRSVSKIIFIIGSAYGIDDSIRKRADLVLSFSKFTFTHQMVRLLLLEQVYRGMTILRGEKYHH